MGKILKKKTHFLPREEKIKRGDAKEEKEIKMKSNKRKE